MRFRKSVPFATAAAIVVLGCAGMPATGVADSDKFTITCDEDGNAAEGVVPRYTCKIKQDGLPKKKQNAGEEFTKQEFAIDMDKLMLFPPSSGDASTAKLACPGWFFINGKWRYYASPPCPWRDEN